MGGCREGNIGTKNVQLLASRLASKTHLEVFKKKEISDCTPLLALAKNPLRISKKTSSYTHHCWESPEICFRAFLKLPVTTHTTVVNCQKCVLGLS